MEKHPSASVNPVIQCGLSNGFGLSVLIVLYTLLWFLKKGNTEYLKHKKGIKIYIIIACLKSVISV